MKATLIGLVILVVVAGIRIVWAPFRSKQRKRALSELAQQLGWRRVKAGVMLRCGLVGRFTGLGCTIVEVEPRWRRHLGQHARHRA